MFDPFSYPPIAFSVPRAQINAMSPLADKIPESDWKLFSKFHVLALDRFFQRALSEIRVLAAKQHAAPREHFCAIHDLTHRQRKDAAELFDDFRRSTALFKLSALCDEGLISDEEFSRFSGETRSFVENFIRPRQSNG